MSDCTFTDAEAAERLLNRHARELAACMDAENLHSAESLMTVTAKRYLERIAKEATND
jgi:hypothetical protein